MRRPDVGEAWGITDHGQPRSANQSGGRARFVRAGAQSGLVHVDGPHAGLHVVNSRRGCVGESAPVLPCRYPSMHGGVRDGSACAQARRRHAALRAAAVVGLRHGVLRHVVPPDLLRSRGAGRGRPVRGRRGLLLAGGALYAAARAHAGLRVRRRQHSGQSGAQASRLARAQRVRKPRSAGDRRHRHACGHGASVRNGMHSCARSCRSRGRGGRFGCRCAFEGGFRLGGLSRSYGVRRAGRPAHARAHVSCRTPHHARAVGYCGGGAGCYPLGELPGDVGRYEREHLHGAAVAHRHDRSGRLRRGVRLRRARAPGRCRVADPIPACAAAHLGGFVRRSHPGEPHGSGSGSSPWSYRSTSCSRTSCSGPSW